MFGFLHKNTRPPALRCLFFHTCLRSNPISLGQPGSFSCARRPWNWFIVYDATISPTNLSLCTYSESAASLLTSPVHQVITRQERSVHNSRFSSNLSVRLASTPEPAPPLVLALVLSVALSRPMLSLLLPEQISNSSCVLVEEHNLPGTPNSPQHITTFNVAFA